MFEDVISGVKAERPGLNDAVAFLRSGDTLVVWKFDCLGRSMKHLVDVAALGDRRIGFRSLTEGVNTTTTDGTLVFHLFSAPAQFERDLIVTRSASLFVNGTVRSLRRVRQLFSRQRIAKRDSARCAVSVDLASFDSTGA